MRPANTVQNKWSPLAPPSHHLTPKASLVIPNSSQVSLASRCWSWLPDVSQGQGQGAQMGWVSKVHAWITYKSEKRGAGLWTALHTEAEAHRKQEEVQPKAKGQGDHGEITEPKTSGLGTQSKTQRFAPTGCSFRLNTGKWLRRSPGEISCQIPWWKNKREIFMLIWKESPEKFQV